MYKHVKMEDGDLQLLNYAMLLRIMHVLKNINILLFLFFGF